MPKAPAQAPGPRTDRSRRRGPARLRDAGNGPIWNRTIRVAHFHWPVFVDGLKHGSHNRCMSTRAARWSWRWGSQTPALAHV